MVKVDPKLTTCGPRVAEWLVATEEQAEIWNLYTRAHLFRQLTLQGLRAHRSIQGAQSWGIESENHLGETVQDQTKRRMQDLRNCYFYAAQSLSDYLPRDVRGEGVDWFPFMVLRNLCNCGALPAWMSDLIWRYREEGLLDTYENDDVVSADEVARRRLERGDPRPVVLEEWGV